MDLENTARMEDFLQKVRQYIHPEKEKTLFSLGGKGHYENPTSDLLAFFLTPSAEHGLKSLFLDAFLECMQIDPGSVLKSGVTVRREVITKDGSRVDLLIEGPEWVMIIENKIYHYLANPFESYELHAKSLRGGTRSLFAVLSPDGRSSSPAWIGVSYKNFCTALRNKFAEAFFHLPYSKWQVFAREFILHLENELYTPSMTPEQAAFIENHAKEIKQVQALASEYNQFLQNLLIRSLEEELPDHTFSIKNEHWALRCYSNNWGQSNIAFWRSDDANPTFRATVYLVNLSETQVAAAHDKMPNTKHWREGSWLAWQTEPGFDSRDEAIAALKKLGSIVTSILLLPIDPSRPATAE